jgi:parvulin-like peptidyl-prolyl isomerase
MNDAKHVQEKWRSEDLRAQRKARLASMKSKDGGKKPISNRNPVRWIILSAILVVAILITGIWMIVRLGLPHRSLTAVTVGGEGIKAVELNYYYRLILSNYGIDPNTSDGQTTLNGASGIEGFPRVSDYLKDSAAQQVQQEVMLYQKALAGGLALDESDHETIAGYLDSITQAAQQKGEDVSSYLVSQYGPGMNLSILEKIFDRNTLASKFMKMKQDSFTFTDEEVEQYYKDNKDTYDVVNYRLFTINSTVATDDTDANKTKGMEEARTKATEMLSRITDGDSFKALCIEYATDSQKEAYESTDKSLVENQYKSSIATDLATWLFDVSRQAGDKTMLDAANGYSILYFIERKRADTTHISVRHILIMAKADTATDEEKTAAKTKAESLLAEFLAGDKSEDSFGELAKANSEDTGSAGNGGLYSDVVPGQMVEAFNDWCFASGRKPGDTGIVESEYGYHVMYFVGDDGPEWKIKVTNALVSDAYSSYIEEAIKEYPYEVNRFGMRFVA